MSKDAESFVKSLHAHGGDLNPDGSVTVGPDWTISYPSKRRPPFAPHKEEKMSETEEEVAEIRKTRNALLEKPVENSGPVPLMPNLDANARHVIVAIRVNKRTPPGDGIKGDVPESTTVDFIARRWGDGIYDFEALNESGQVLRRNTNVKIAMGYQSQSEVGIGNPLQKLMIPGQISDGMSEKLLERLDKTSERAYSASESALQATQKLSQDYASMIREDSRERSEKDRAYHKAQADNQATFFQAMIVNMQQMHRQAMETSREQFQQTMQMMQFSHQQTLAQNNPALLLQLFERGLKFGAEAGGGDAEESPLTSILGAATQGLSTVKEMMQLQAAPAAGILPASIPAQASKARQNPGKKPPISKEDMLEVLRLKKIAESKGLDFSGLVKQAQAMVSNMPVEQPEQDDQEEEEDEESPEGNDSESGSPDVD